MSDELKEIISQLKGLNQKFDLLIHGLVQSGRLNGVTLTQTVKLNLGGKGGDLPGSDGNSGKVLDSPGSEGGRGGAGGKIFYE